MYNFKFIIIYVEPKFAKLQPLTAFAKSSIMDGLQGPKCASVLKWPNNILTHSLPMHRKVFWCFHGVEKGYIGNEWVKAIHAKILLQLHGLQRRKCTYCMWYPQVMPLLNFIWHFHTTKTLKLLAV